LVIVLAIVLAASVVYAAELVNNGDFSAGTSGWTPQGGTNAFVDATSCGSGEGIAEVRNHPGHAGIEQCVRITSPGTDWMLSVDAAGVLGEEIAIETGFWSGMGCDGSLQRTELITTTFVMISTPVPLSHYSHTFAYDTAADGANSVRISAQIPEDLQPSSGQIGCFDNISLSAPGATFVGTRGISASQPSILPLVIVLGSLGLLATVFLVKKLRE
jgi:hypothetical protein